MTTLVLLRHAKSDWDGEEPDIERPLASRGHRQAVEAGQWLEAHVPAIDLAVVSPAVRVAQTWELVASVLGTPPPTRVDDRVYAASVQDLLEVVRDLPAEASTVVLVGHNPGLEDFIRLLTGQITAMTTSAIAVLELASPWSDLNRATLVAAGRPPSQG